MRPALSFLKKNFDIIFQNGRNSSSSRWNFTITKPHVGPKAQNNNHGKETASSLNESEGELQNKARLVSRNAKSEEQQQCAVHYQRVFHHKTRFTAMKCCYNSLMWKSCVLYFTCIQLYRKFELNIIPQLKYKAFIKYVNCIQIFNANFFHYL